MNKLLLHLAVISVLVGSDAKRLSVHKKMTSSDYPAYPEHEGNHWRDEQGGSIDNGEGDAEIIEMFSLQHTKPKKKVVEETFPWNYDHDVVATAKSIHKAEKMVGNQLTYRSVAAYKGKDMLSDAGFSKRHHRLHEAPKPSNSPPVDSPKTFPASTD